MKQRDIEYLEDLDKSIRSFKKICLKSMAEQFFNEFHESYPDLPFIKDIASIINIVIPTLRTEDYGRNGLTLKIEKLIEKLQNDEYLDEYLKHFTKFYYLEIELDS